LARHQVRQEVAEVTKETPEAPKERSENSSGLVRYAALHKSIAVQAALLQNPRKAKEVAAVSLLLGLLPSKRLRIDVHPCFTAWDASEKKPKALSSAFAELSRISRMLGIEFDARTRPSIANGSIETSVALYQAVQGLSDDDLEQLRTVLVLLSFGQSSIDELDTGESLFSRVAADLGLAMRVWWTPDAEFLALLRKDQLEAVAIESGASLRMAKLKSYGKKELVDALAQYFARTADPEATLDEHDSKARTWLSAVMSFPGRSITTSKNPE
jgi:ParB family chromosome partitioning protein